MVPHQESRSRFMVTKAENRNGAEKYWNARLVNGAMRTAIESVMDEMNP